jgi:alpha-beta hydrolase superfamily lysophospholipase
VIAQRALSLSKRIALFLLGGLSCALVIGTGLAAYYLESRDDLKPWHEVTLTQEFSLESPDADFPAYLSREARLFEELRRKLQNSLASADRTAINRYAPGSLSDPDNWERNWNRSYILEQRDPKAVFVLIHGMSDSPYSLNNLAERLHDAGGEVIGLRLPGHGTLPAGLLDVTWQDMSAAVSLAVKHAKDRARSSGAARTYLVGYSVGATLAMHHTLDSLQSGADAVDGLVLLSPAIGLPAVAKLAIWQQRLSSWFGLRKVAWNSISLEYDPFKYGSFAINAAIQSALVTDALRSKLRALATTGALDGLPPILAFQSSVDATVSSRSVVEDLFLTLPAGDCELVLYDVNRLTEAVAVLADDPKPWMDALLARDDLPFTLSVVTNLTAENRETVVIRHEAGKAKVTQSLLGIDWPPSVFSLSHVSLPFPATDSLYGDGIARDSPGIELGILSFRGERGALKISANDMLRLRWNPFYSYQERRILDFVGFLSSQEQSLEK